MQELRGPDTVHVAAWQPAKGSAPRISLKGGKLFCHFLNDLAFAMVADHREYNITTH